VQPRSIATLLFAAVMLTVLSVVTAAALLFRLSLGQGFDDYVTRVELTRLTPLEDALAARYHAEGGWDFVHGPRDLLPAPPPPQGPPGDEQAGPVEQPGQPPRFTSDGRPLPRRPMDLMDLGRRLALFDVDGHRLAGPPEAEQRPKREIHGRDNGPLIGYLALAPLRDSGDVLTSQFLATQTRNLALIALLAVLASATAAWYLARQLRRPIAALANGARKLAEGKLDTRVELQRQDELGALAKDFNLMAQRLERFEQSRRQWVADTSHELRTPLTVLRAHTQAMRDGVLPLNERSLEVLDGAVNELDKLVSDLYQLARADVGAHEFQLEPVLIDSCLDELAQRFQEPLRRAELTLAMSALPQVLINGDPARLQQLFGNLMVNAIRYTDRGGEIRLDASVQGQWLQITLDDTPPGVPDAALPRLFERFYRVDSSRSRASGGSGLGLAICLAIVDGHGGRIVAGHSPLGGLRVTITLPILQVRR
jgi:two-component system sensor histidine kinase BaeS